MRVSVLLNRHSGTLRGMDSAALVERIGEAFREAGGEAQVELVAGRDLMGRLRAVRDASPAPDAIVIGGGDGSVSSTARELLHSDIALGVLPLGTFNLFARAIDMPLDPFEAVDVLAAAKPMTVDTMEVNGRTVLQHASIGLQPRVILLREEQRYANRVEKLAHGLRAWIKAIRRPPRLELKTISEQGEAVLETPALLISNNAIREGLGKAPVSADLHQSRIAVYACTSSRRGDLVKVTVAAAFGLWRETGLIEEMIAREVVISTRRPHLLMSIDGELQRLDTPLRCRSVPRSLNVLLPEGWTCH